MFELADYLVGIYKVEDCTQSLTIENFDKQMVLGNDDKETEKENISENLLTSPSVSKTSLVLGENQSQAMETDENEVSQLSEIVTSPPSQPSQ